MKVLLLGDIHYDLYALRGITYLCKQKALDAIISVGDILPNDAERLISKKDGLEEGIGAFYSDVFCILKEIGVPIIWVPGNWDLYPSQANIDGVTNACSRWSEIYFKVGPLDIWGVGGTSMAGMGWANDWGDDGDVIDLNKNNLVMVTHAPPFGTMVDTLHNNSGHAGSLRIRKMIEKNAERLRLAVCGHIHEAKGIDYIENVPLINAGIVGEELFDKKRMQSIYSFTILELSKSRSHVEYHEIHPASGGTKSVVVKSEIV